MFAYPFARITATPTWWIFMVPDSLHFALEFVDSFRNYLKSDKNDTFHERVRTYVILSFAMAARCNETNCILCEVRAKTEE